MKATLLKMAVVVLALLVFTGAALAEGVRLRNADARSYRLHVKHRGSGVHTSIAPQTATKICSSACTIKVKSSGATFSARSGDRLVIKNGKISRAR
jgi:hypothetical protein